MGLLRNQVGAAIEILKAREHIARVAFVPTAAAMTQDEGEGAHAPRTPLLDQLGPLDDFKPLTEATLPEVQACMSRL